MAVFVLGCSNQPLLSAVCHSAHCRRLHDNLCNYEHGHAADDLVHSTTVIAMVKTYEAQVSVTSTMTVYFFPGLSQGHADGDSLVMEGYIAPNQAVPAICNLSLTALECGACTIYGGEVC